MTDSSTTPGQTSVSRRTLAKGMAWSVPAIAIAGATPAFAASPECLTAEVSADSCKCPGKSTGDPFGYRLGLCFTNNCDSDITNLVVTQVRNVSGEIIYSDRALTTPMTFSAISVPQGTTVCTQTLIGFSTNSAGKLIVSYSIGGQPQPEMTIAAPPKCEDIGAPCPE